MKAIISGRLAAKPERRLADLARGKTDVVNGTVYVDDPKSAQDENGHRKSIPCSFTAWGDNAIKISENYDKGDVITFTAQVRAKDYTPGGVDSGNKTIIVPNYVVERIDPENIIQKQFSNEVIQFNKGEIDKFGDGKVYQAPGKDIEAEDDVPKDLEPLDEDEEHDVTSYPEDMEADMP